MLSTADGREGLVWRDREVDAGSGGRREPAPRMETPRPPPGRRAPSPKEPRRSPMTSSTMGTVGRGPPSRERPPPLRPVRDSTPHAHTRAPTRGGPLPGRPRRRPPPARRGVEGKRPEAPGTAQGGRCPQDRVRPDGRRVRGTALAPGVRPGTRPRPLRAPRGERGALRSQGRPPPAAPPRPREGAPVSQSQRPHPQAAEAPSEPMAGRLCRRRRYTHRGRAGAQTHLAPSRLAPRKTREAASTTGGWRRQGGRGPGRTLAAGAGGGAVRGPKGARPTIPLSTRPLTRRITVRARAIRSTPGPRAAQGHRRSRAAAPSPIL